ncbi:tld family protein, putative [Ichthyophthirius multifiliis]|uniref:Tld family protein, putative n=1 Tax=Ichthyophthirius multifiliis TaxID=5932 RepID=G0R1M3_ICHMU|nr:tld family protein, putative [Ichthyophthirius multifiliis]EGR28633.1 tld family protein, putative [Ichthyophthirius multifiliis]|eukprot:XP_004029869.1 tld family protein, putative [Ichthyophthirius multifiliis]
MRLMRPIILDIYKRTYADNKVEFQIALKIVFKDIIPQKFKQNYVFSQDNRPIEEIVKINVLSKEGYDSLKRILWILKEMYYQIEYNPMIIQIAALLLIFIKEEEVYCVLKYMVEDSIKLLTQNNQQDQDIQRSLRWHFLMNKNDFVKFQNSFFDTLVEKSATFNEIMNHFKEVNFDYIEYFLDMVNNLFYGYLNFSAVIKFFIMYLNEGMKVYFRFMYSLCYYLKDDILKVNQKKKKIKKKRQEIDQEQKAQQEQKDQIQIQNKQNNQYRQKIIILKQKQKIKKKKLLILQIYIQKYIQIYRYKYIYIYIYIFIILFFYIYLYKERFQFKIKQSQQIELRIQQQFKLKI